MEAVLTLESDDNHRQPYPDIVSTIADLIPVAQGSHIVPSEPYDPMGNPLHACQSLVG